MQVEQANHADLAAGAPGPGPAGPAGHPAAAAQRTAQQQTDGANAGADGPPEDGSPGAGVRRHVHHPRPSDPGTPHHCGERFPGSPCHPCEAHGEQWSGDQARLHPCRPSRPGLRRRRRGGPRRHHRGGRRRCRRPPAGRGRGRTAGHPLLRMPPRRLPRLAVGGHRHPGVAQQDGDHLRDGAAARPRRAARARLAALAGAAQAGRPRPRRPAADLAGRRAAGPRLPALRRPGGRGDGLGAGPRSGPGALPRGSHARRRSAGTTATTAPPRPSPPPRRPPPAAAPAASTCRWPVRCGRRSGRAATSTPPTTAGW